VTSRNDRPGATMRAPDPVVLERRVVEVAVERIDGEEPSPLRDVLAVEEPLDIRVGYGPAGGGGAAWITAPGR